MKNLALLIGILFSAFCTSAFKISKKVYVEMWKDVAIGEMLDHKIPASITLAQGILESGIGNSMLALEANNHFGIKCHGWAGEKIYKDDDKKNECFRKYDSAEESFEDHSDFLLSHQRYSSLFSLSITDYKGWARGLRNAGYATNPKYSELLIGLIEELRLNEYDTYKGIGIDADALTQDIDSEEIRTNEHFVRINDNRVRFVIAKKGDTFYQIAEEFDLTLRQLNRYNSFPEYKDCLSQGDLVYVMPKRKAKIFKKEVISMEEPMYVNEISQKYGVAEKTLKRLNDFAKDSLVSKGEIITLR